MSNLYERAIQLAAKKMELIDKKNGFTEGNEAYYRWQAKEYINGMPNTELLRLMDELEEVPK